MVRPLLEYGNCIWHPMLKGLESDCRIMEFDVQPDLYLRDITWITGSGPGCWAA